MSTRRSVFCAIAAATLGVDAGKCAWADAGEADLKRRAQIHFARGEAAEQRGDYRAAIGEYRSAYRISPAASVLYNIARDEEQLDDALAAADDYQRYIDESIALEDAETVRQKISALRGREGTRLVNLALQAKGGAAGLKGVKAFVARGTMVMTDPAGQVKESRFTRWVQGTARARVELDLGNGVTEVQVVTPETSWVERGGMVLLPQRLEELDARAAFWRDKDLILLRPREEGAAALAMGAEISRGKSYDVVVMSRPDGSARTKLWLDPGTHLPAIIEGETSTGRARAEIRSYRTVAGIKFAVAHTSESGGIRIEVRVDEVTLNPDLRPGLFERSR